MTSPAVSQSAPPASPFTRSPYESEIRSVPPFGLWRSHTTTSTTSAGQMRSPPSGGGPHRIAPLPLAHAAASSAHHKVILLLVIRRFLPSRVELPHPRGGSSPPAARHVPRGTPARMRR